MIGDSGRRLFIDQVFSGFDWRDPVSSAARFCDARRPLLDSEAVEYILEFPECCVDTYENIVAYEPGAACDVQRNIQLWRSAREPGSRAYWTAAEFAALVQALRDGGIHHIMVRTFLTFEGQTGTGRYLRESSGPHVAAFEWRRADEFVRRHPEVRDAKDHLLNWDETMREDPLYAIPAGLTVGEWFGRQLFGFLGRLGVDVVRLGDGSAGGRLWTSRKQGAALCRHMHESILAMAHARSFRILGSLGPYWSFDAWRQELGIAFSDLPRLADALLTQPLECWTHRYGLTYPHNGEYFNAQCGRVHALVNAVAAPEAVFVRGLDAGDAIENWHPPETMPFRETLDTMLLFREESRGPTPVYHGVYHFWSDELSPRYYERQSRLHAFLAAHPPVRLDGPVLVVTPGHKPHPYTMADFLEACGYGLNASCAARDVHAVAGRTYVHFLPRLPGDEAILDESALEVADSESLAALLDSPANLIVFGGSRDALFLRAFGVRLAAAGEFLPAVLEIGGREVRWEDTADQADCRGMAGQPERFKRRHELVFEAAGAEVLAAARDIEGLRRVVVTRHRTATGAWRVLVAGAPEAAARACGAAVVAEPCGLPYRIRSEGSVSSASWEDRAGDRYLALFRYDRCQAHAVPLHLEGLNVGEVCLASGAVCEEGGRIHLEPQGCLILKWRMDKP